MARTITTEGTYSNTEAVIRQRFSRMFDDCVLATVASGTTTTAVLATTNPPQFFSKPDSYFNKNGYEVYTYAGINIGESAAAYAWTLTTPAHTLTVDRTLTAFTTASKLELHRIFNVIEYRDAENQGIDFFGRGKYLIDLKDETTISLTEGTDNLSNTLYTYEYALPTNMVYLHRVTTEGAVSGKKLTGTVSGAFTLGETITEGTATGILSYGPASGTYILVREVSGTFAIGGTATGGTSGKTCSAITAVADETVGDGKFEMEDVVDPRDYSILRAYTPKIKFDEDQYSIVGDLRIRLEGQGIQGNITADTDTIFLPPDELIEVAATFLPFSKVESNNLTAVFNKCLEARARVEARPPMAPYPNARKCW